MQLNDLPNNDPGLKVTDSALIHLKNAVAKQTMPVQGVRVGVKKAGCSGFEYTMALETKDPTEIDFVFSFNGINVIIDKEIYLKFFKGGTTMDYRIEGLKQGIEFDNPNVAAQCGCGESFTLK